MQRPLQPRGMGHLVLCRRLGERICVGKDLVITVLEIDGNVVRFGIDKKPGTLVVAAVGDPHWNLNPGNQP